MANPKFAAAVAVNRNRGGIPKAKSLVGGAHSVGPEPSGDYDEVDSLHRALGSAIVDKIMSARKMAEGGEVGQVRADEEGDFLAGNDQADDEGGEFDDGMDNGSQGTSEDESDDDAGEGDGGAQDKPSYLKQIMASIRRKHMGR